MELHISFKSAIVCVCLLAPSIALSANSAHEPTRNLKHEDQPFTHPGVLVSASQLSLIKREVSLKHEPWTSAYESLLVHPLGSLTRKPNPFPTVNCGPTSTPNIGCYDERRDALAAYGMSLAWIVTGGQKYADKAIEYMNAWSSTIKTHINSNAPLQTGWAGAVWPRVGEIIRYSKAGWKDRDIKAFENMLRDVYLPEVIVGSSQNGNWELVMMEAALGISVFISNRTSYNIALSKFLDRVPAYIYLLSDGPLPRTSPEDHLHNSSQIIKYWQGISNFSLSGLSQETCRDLNHTGYGFESISHVSETSRIQGRDLWIEDTGDRVRIALELHAGWQLRPETVPAWLCGGKLAWNLGPTTEVSYNALATRLLYDLPNLRDVTLKERPAEYGTNLPLFYSWETLSHGANTA